jgi:glucokinase
MTSPVSPYERGRKLVAGLREPAPVLGIDIGGTKLAAGVVAPGGEVLSYLRQPTLASLDAEGLLAAVVELGKRACLESKLQPVATGIGCGGPIFFEEDTVSPLHIPAWRKFPLRSRLEEALGLPAVLDNDAKAFALGEALFGAGRGARCMLGMVVSTGIGGGIVVEGRLLDGAHGNGGHVGHIIVSVRGPRCFCGAVGCLTAYAAGRGLSARAVAALKRGTPSSLGALPPEAITGKAITEAAHMGDAIASRLVRDAALALGRAIATAANILDLDRVVLGGGLIQAGDLLLGPMHREIRRRARLAFSRHVEVRTAELGPGSGVIGAASLVLQHWQRP